MIALAVAGVLILAAAAVTFAIAMTDTYVDNAIDEHVLAALGPDEPVAPPRQELRHDQAR